jgi:flagellar motor switch protein FliG
VAASVVEELLVDFISGMSGAGAIMGSFEQTQRLLAPSCPPRRSTP